MSNKCLRHEPCPRCGSRNNLGVYDDHKYCFGCGYYVPVTSFDLHRIQSRFGGNYGVGDASDGDNRFCLPVGTTRFDKVAAEWLSKYNIDHIERSMLGCYWANQERWLVIPFYVEEKPVAYTARNFSGNGPKYLSAGTKPVHVYSRHKNSPYLILCEDPISAVRVSSQMDSSPVLGAALDYRRVKTIQSKGYKNIAFWLDLDKADVAMKLSAKYGNYFDNVKVVVSKKDPKCYDEIGVGHFLGKFL